MSHYQTAMKALNEYLAKHPKADLSKPMDPEFKMLYGDVIYSKLLDLKKPIIEESEKKEANAILKGITELLINKGIIKAK